MLRAVSASIRDTGGVDAAKTIEATFAVVLKQRGFRQRGRNWFRTTRADEYQVVNLQKSSWGSGNCYLNLGWDPGVTPGEFRSENQCAVSLRAEDTDVILPIHRLRPDGVTEIELPGITLLTVEVSRVMAEDDFAAELTEVIVEPLANLLDRTPSFVDLVPLLTAKPWFATLRLRDELRPRGYELPTS